MDTLCTNKVAATMPKIWTYFNKNPHIFKIDTQMWKLHRKLNFPISFFNLVLFIPGPRLLRSIRWFLWYKRNLYWPGNPERCSLLVLYCDTPGRAERICSDVAQCFQLVYTDAVVQLLEDTIGRVENSSTGSPTINNENGRKYSL